MKQLHLGWFGSTGPSAWNEPTGNLYDWRQRDLAQDVARLCERAKLDFILFADTSALPSTYERSTRAYVEHAVGVSFDPLMVMATMAAATTKIGLGSTISTTLTPPYLLARQVATLDHLSGGRVAWNVVTSANSEAAWNFGLDDLPEHDKRYEMADEYLKLVRGLWDSWEPDAVSMDRKTGRFADPSKVHTLDFEGKYYKSRGPLTVPSSPQGHPVIIMAGVSPRGIRFAVENAEMVIVHQSSVEGMRRHTQALRDQLSDAGRDPYSCKIFFAIKPIIGDTHRHAEELRDLNRAKASVEKGLLQLSANLGHDLSTFDLDKPLPKDLPANLVGHLQRHTEGPNPPTLREIGLQESQNETFPIYGTAEECADAMEEFAAATDIDGFHFRTEVQDLEYLFRVATRLLPVLQDRGLFRREYTGSTLREHLFGPAASQPAAR